MKKFEKSEIQNLFSVKGGAAIGGKTSTTTLRTVETSSDSDSNAGIESPKRSDSVFEI